MFTFFLDKTKNLTQDMFVYGEKLERIEFQKYDKLSDWFYGIGLLFCIPAYNTILSCLLIVELVMKLIIFIFLHIKNSLDKYSTKKNEDQRFSEHIYYCFISTLLPFYSCFILSLTVIYNAINLFQPLFSSQEKSEKNKYNIALLDYEQQLLLDLQEREEILETFGYFEQIISNYSRAYSQIDKSQQSNSKKAKSDSVDLCNIGKRMDPETEFLNEKIAQFGFLINHYPTIQWKQNNKSFDIQEVQQKRYEHHQQVKALAEFLFNEFHESLKTAEKNLEAQNNFLPKVFNPF